MGTTLLLIGLGLMVLALVADTAGIGGGRGFGFLQLIAFIAGMAAVLLAGAILLQPRLSQHDDTGYQDERDTNDLP